MCLTYRELWEVTEEQAEESKYDQGSYSVTRALNGVLAKAKRRLQKNDIIRLIEIKEGAEAFRDRAIRVSICPECGGTLRTDATSHNCMSCNFKIASSVGG